MSGEPQPPAPLTLDGALTLLGPRCGDIHLNGDSHWAAVPINVSEYILGGYQVLKKWLSYRELPLPGRPLHPEEARYFGQVRRIAAILLMGPALDDSYSSILPALPGHLSEGRSPPLPDKARPQATSLPQAGAKAQP
jgi:hypothetical protein